MKKKFIMRALAVASVIALSVLAASPASAGSLPKSGSITGQGTIYYATPNYHGKGALSLTSMHGYTDSCGGSQLISLRGTSGRTAAVTQWSSIFLSSISFRNLGAPSGFAYTWAAGTKWFTFSQSGVLDDCVSSWSGTFNYVNP